MTTTAANKTIQLSHFIARMLPQYRTLECMVQLHLEETMYFDAKAFEKINTAASCYYDFHLKLLPSVSKLFLITCWDEDELNEFLALCDKRNISVIVCEYYLTSDVTNVVYEVWRNTSNMFYDLI